MGIYGMTELVNCQQKFLARHFLAIPSAIKKEGGWNENHVSKH